MSARAITEPLRSFFFPPGARVRAAPFTFLSAVGVVLGLLLGFSDAAQRLDWTLYDRYMRIATRNPDPPSDLVVVAIDELSFTEIGQPWPWPRRMHAALTDALSHAGARTIVFDLLFDLPSTQAEDDRRFAQAIRSAGNVILAADRAEVNDRAYRVVQWVDPTPMLAGVAAGTGVVRLQLDPDGVLRRSPLAVDGKPTLALAAARQRSGYDVAADLDRPRLIRFRGPPRLGITTVSYYQALQPDAALPPDIFKDKTVLVGFSLGAPAGVEETADSFGTPVAVRMPGVQIHAAFLDTLLHTAAIADPFGWLPVAIALALGLGIVTAFLLYRTSPAPAAARLAGFGAAWAIGSYGLLAWAGLHLPVIAPLAAVAATYATGEVYRYSLVRRERRFIKGAFEHYVAPAIVDEMLADPSKLTLGGEEHDVTILFTDLQGFTTLSEAVSPEELRRHLSAYFTEMLAILLKERATLDKLIGDSIMAYFGCPIPDATHPAQACRSALAMQRRMVDLNRQWQARGLPALRTRIGINSGTVVAGNMGTPDIFNYTILGDTVNLASRLEGVNKEYGSLTIIGEATWSRVQERFEARELDFIRVEGKQQPVAIYELAAARGELDIGRAALFSRFATGLAAYRDRRWEPAAAAFRGALALDPTDGPSRTFVARCEHYAAQPPPSDWGGVHVMHVK